MGGCGRERGGLRSPGPAAVMIICHGAGELGGFRGARPGSPPGPRLDYYQGGANDEVTLSGEPGGIRPHPAALPRSSRHIPTGYEPNRPRSPSAHANPGGAGRLLGMARPDGDAAAARAAAAGSIFVLSTLSMTPVEDVARAAD